MTVHDKVELLAAISTGVNAIAAAGLLYVTWRYTKLTKQMADSMHKDFKARQSPAIGRNAPQVVTNTWDELVVKHEITNVGEYSFSIELAVLELDGLISDGQSARITRNVQMALPQQVMPSAKIDCMFVLAKQDLQEHSHPNVTTPLRMYRAELSYIVRSLAGILHTYRFPISAS